MTTTSTAHGTLPTPEDDPVVNRLLDVATATFEDVGFRRSTVEDIARRAGVERVTVYRRLGAKNEIVKAVTLREAQRVFAEVAERADATDSLDDRITATFIGLISELRSHPLYTRLMRIEPDETLPRVTTEASGPLAWAIHYAVMVLGPEVAEQAGGVELLTARVEIIARTIHSIILTPKAVTHFDTEEQLEEFARKHIVPLVTASSG